MNLFIALLAVALQPPAWGEGEWLTVSENATVRIDLDEASTRREGDRVQIRMRGDLPSAPGGLRWMLTRLEIDCRSKAARNLELIEYRADASLIRHAEGDAAAAMAPAPAPDGEIRDTFAAICHRTGWGEEGAAE